MHSLLLKQTSIFHVIFILFNYSLFIHLIRVSRTIISSCLCNCCCLGCFFLHVMNTEEAFTLSSLPRHHTLHSPHPRYPGIIHCIHPVLTTQASYIAFTPSSLPRHHTYYKNIVINSLGTEDAFTSNMLN